MSLCRIRPPSHPANRASDYRIFISLPSILTVLVCAIRTQRFLHTACTATPAKKPSSTVSSFELKKSVLANNKEPPCWRLCSTFCFSPSCHRARVAELDGGPCLLRDTTSRLPLVGCALPGLRRIWTNSIDELITAFLTLRRTCNTLGVSISCKAKTQTIQLPPTFNPLSRQPCLPVPSLPVKSLPLPPKAKTKMKEAFPSELFLHVPLSLNRRPSPLLPKTVATAT